MQAFELKERMFDNVVNGIKLATLRKGDRNYDTGETVIVGTERNRALLVTVSAINKFPLSELTLDDARQEGYKCRQDLIDVMTEIYGELDDDQIVTQVWWNFTKEF